MSTLLQLWREVCDRSPALVNQEGKHLIVGEADLLLLGSEIERTMLAAAPTPAAQSAGQEAVAEVRSKHGDPEAFGERELVLFADIQKMPYGTKFYTAPVNGGERALAEVAAEIAASQQPLGFSRSDAERYAACREAAIERGLFATASEYDEMVDISLKKKGKEVLTGRGHNYGKKVAKDGTLYRDQRAADASQAGGERGTVQWWLVDLDMYGNPKLSDGAHSDRAGADKAAYLHSALGLKHDRKLAVARVELFEPKPDASSVNHEAVSQCNAARAALSADGGELSNEQIVSTAKTAGVCLVMDKHFGDSNYTSVSASWPTFAAFARAIAAKAKGE